MIGPITDFPYLLEQVSGHMYPTGDLPELNGVFFEARGSSLYSVATDRHTLAVARRRLESGPSEPWGVLVGGQALKSLRAFARFNRRIPLMLEHRAGMCADALAVRADGQTLEVPGGDLPLTKPWAGGMWRRLLTDALGTTPDLRQEVCLNPTLLARWGKSGGAARNEPLTVWGSGVGKPLVVACGEDFLGMQMPIRPGQGASPRRDVLAHWDDLTPHPVAGGSRIAANVGRIAAGAA
ncbi:hypothetical protein [Streptomyces sp. NPDC019890]|uniref:hypothetical protein n=1 Tax=Streptomyces sp. NPDC019890 TaxID=3365064 RepID=UPI00384CCA10